MLGRRTELAGLFLAAMAATILGMGGAQTVLAANPEMQMMEIEKLLQTDHGKTAMAKLGLSLDDVRELTKKLSPEQLRSLQKMAKDAHPKARLTARMVAAGYTLDEAKERISVFSDVEVTKLANDTTYMDGGEGRGAVALILLLLLALLGLLWWWLSGEDDDEEPAIEPEPGDTTPLVVPAAGKGNVLYEPTDQRQGSVILVEKFAPSEVMLGQPYDYLIKVTNLTDSQLVDVVLTDKLPGGFKVNSSTPAAKNVPVGKVAWALGELGPKASKTIKVKGTATGRGTNVHCGTVTYKRPYCVAVNVVDPKLELAKTAPAVVMLCDPIPLKMVVKNSGTGTARNVKVVDNLPAGLTTLDGKTSVTLNAGDLKAGESKEFTTTVKAAKTGTYNNTATATADGGRKATAKTTTVVRQPVLTLTKTGTARQFLGRTAVYKLTVRNTGDAVAANTMITDVLPAGATFVSASDNGLKSGDKVTWSLGDLAPKAAKTVTLTVKSDVAAVLVNSAEASAKCAKAVAATAKTVYVGIPAVLLEVIDVEDPVEVGGTETYVITVTNQGTAADTNVKIVCTLEANEEYVSSSGTTVAAVRGRTITFAPVASLAPKAKASWRVVVKAVKEGDVRFKVKMDTDQLTRPVDETEATNIYK
jgi:uncharacterized repeat protein (TIGR01451 family)